MSMFEELTGSPTLEIYGGFPGGGKMTRAFVCDWDKRYEVLKYLLTGSMHVFEAGPGWWVQSDVRISPFDQCIAGEPVAGGTLAKYGKAKIEITYALTTHADGPRAIGPYYTEEMHTALDWFPVPPSTVVWEKDGEYHLMDEQFRPRTAVSSYVVTYYDVLKVPFNVVGWLNSCNASPVWILGGLSVLPQCMLYTGAWITRDHKLGSLARYRVRLEFTIRGWSWNGIPDLADKVVRPLLYKDTSGRKPRLSVFTPHPPRELGLLLP